MVDIKDKIRGMLLGTVIGDSLGLPCEGYSAEKIKETFGRITDYQISKNEKYHKDLPLASWSDDTDLTLAVLQGLMNANGFDLDEQAECHVEAYKTSTFGWGSTTRMAVANLANGVSWRDSGLIKNTSGKQLGMGNGVSMKVCPIGAYYYLNNCQSYDLDKIANFTGMTHRTSVAVSSCFAHIFAIYYCLSTDNLDKRQFINFIHHSSLLGRNYYANTLKDDLSDRIETLKQIDKTWTNEDIFKEYITSSYFYVYNSLPFTYAFFLRNPNSIESMYEVIAGGGDTDTNASMLGSLLGALHGVSIFPDHLINGLKNKDEIIQIADKFTQKFKGI